MTISLGEVAQVITALGVFVTALSSIWNRIKLNRIQEGVNGHNEALMQVTSEAEFAKGVKSEKDKQDQEERDLK